MGKPRLIAATGAGQQGVATTAAIANGREGIIPAIESAHAMKLDPAMRKDQTSLSPSPAGGTRMWPLSRGTEGRTFMSKIASAFTKGKAFIPFLTCGHPDLETTAVCVRAAAANGADLIELGIPFSGPTAEGPVIQEADNLRALTGA